ncbi:MAG: hypothetical protein P8Z76_12320 [Alphaproteobacteria bacterium]
MLHTRPFRHAAARFGVIAGIAVVSITDGAPPAAAQAKVDADFAKYCRTHFPNSLPTRRGIRRFCTQRGTLQGVDLGEACRLTTGSRRYERDGARILCLRPKRGGRTTRRRTVGEPDFRRYCRTKYPNSTYIRRAGRVTHLCRQPGRVQGYVMHNIDLAAACRQSHGVSGYVRSGNRVLCRRNARTPSSRRNTAACRRVCNAQPSAGARNLCFRQHRLCRGR